MKTSITAYQGSFNGTDQGRINQYIAQGGSASAGNAPVSEGLQAQMDACGTDTACRDQVAQTMQNWGSGGIDQAESGGTLSYPSQSAPTPVRATTFENGGIYDNGYQVGQRTGPTADLPPTYATGIGWFDKYILQIPDRTPTAEQAPAPVYDAVSTPQPSPTVYTTHCIAGDPTCTEGPDGRLNFTNPGTPVTSDTPADTGSDGTPVAQTGFSEVQPSSSCHTGIFSFLNGAWNNCANGIAGAEQAPAPVEEPFVRPNVPPLDVPQQEQTVTDTGATSPFYDMSKGNNPEQVTGLSSEWLQKISDRCANDPLQQGCILNNIDSVKATGELQPSIPSDEPLPGFYQGGESFIKDASYNPEQFNYFESGTNSGDSGVAQPSYDPGIFDNSFNLTNLIQTANKPTRQFSAAEPSSNLPENQSLAASVFSAFLGLEQ